jgi:hypothetical protein
MKEYWGSGSIQGCIQKFPDWVDNEITSNTKGYGGKTHQTDPQNSDATAPSGRELYHLQFSLQASSPENFGYTLVAPCILDLDTRWSFTPRPLHIQGRSPWYLLNRKLGWSQSRSGRSSEEKKIPAPAGNLTPVVQPVA